MRSYNFCNNCGKSGHLYHQCNNPITSIGLIIFRRKNNKTEYLLIRRKDSLGYVDFMRGKYPIGNKIYLANIIQEMTIDERKRLLTKEFSELWHTLWGENIGIQYRGEEKTSKEKFYSLRNGIEFNNNNYLLEDFIKKTTTTWHEPEWGFPKGRRNYQEKDILTALREFQEETGYNTINIKVIQNLIPFEEIFTGSNYKSYKHKYYLGYMNNNTLELPSNYQKTEVSGMQWCSFEECLNKIRPYNLEKKNLLKRINKLIEEYRLY
jgi:8-oxo-dGTP pyrophosphatase MutT (NUDIX family)